MNIGFEGLTALTRGIVAIITTIIVLALKLPHAEDLAGLAEHWPAFRSVLLSFACVATYRNNHWDR